MKIEELPKAYKSPFPLIPEPINVPLKFSSVAIIPSELTDRKHVCQKYKLVGGEVVTLRFLGTWDNRKGEYDDMFDKECRELYDIDFASFKSVWKRRLGALSEYWHKVELELAE